MNILRIVLSASIATFTLNSAMAAGSSSEPAAKVEKCADGEVYDKKAKECVKEEESSLNDADLLDNGRALAYAGRFEEAVKVLNKIENKQTAEVQNYLGFSSRNAGNIDKGLAHYRTALSINPDYTLARSYMGQALLKKGDRAGAVIQLSEIKDRVGTEAREYKLLAASLHEHYVNGSIVY
ncbi:tetratricopeptide repeat protein [Ahrensia marina]|uniref:Uncharacterized protein n=1 Tax=Ahrensia marina TaxID=1514904 RepID=A0A0N0VLG2_9HYPH|nr:tetratricopeptide repeat protein [Ahrensia marina]KPB01194.1 hypothetical protein SU32_09925 [Ahrensia marina]